MRESPLVFPILLDPTYTPPKDGHPPCLPFRPTHLASWQYRPPSGLSVRRTALAAPDNSIWIISSSEPSSSSSSIRHVPPTIITSPALPSASSSQLTSPKRSPPKAGRPSASRHASYAGRSRAPSTASSVITSSSASTAKRRAAFSPPPSATQLPRATLTSATATAAPPDSHRPSVDRNDLLDHLREQKGEVPEPQYVGLGLGLGGRRLPVHGKDDHDGAATPRTTTSMESSRTIGTRFRAWTQGDDEEKEKERKELADQIAEIEVEREMQKGMVDAEKGEQDMKAVEDASKSPIPSSPLLHRPSDGKGKGRREAVKRIVLPDHVRGKVVCLKILDDIDALGVLRDEGLLDIISLSTLSHLATINLEEPEERKPSPEASSSKSPLRLSPFWQWRGLHVIKSHSSCFIAAHGVHWPSAIPNFNGDITRVVFLHMTHSGTWHIESRLELPGVGEVGVCSPNGHAYLLHAAEHSFTSYPIVFPPTTKPPSRAATPSPQLRATPQMRAVSSLNPSSMLAPTPRLGSPANDGEPVVRRNRSFASLRDTAQEQPKEKGFAKLLAVARKADWQGKPSGKEEEEGRKGIELGEGKEVERDGYGHWTKFIIRNDGQGLGLSSDAIHAIHCDGEKLQVKGLLSLDNGLKALDACFISDWKRIDVQTEKSLASFEPAHVKSPGGALQFVPSDTHEGPSSLGMGREDEVLMAAGNEVVSVPSGAARPNTICSLEEYLADARTPTVVPFHVDRVFTADGNGNVCSQSMMDYLQNEKIESSSLGTDRLDSRISCIKLVNSPLAEGGQYLVAGDEDGVIRIWTASTFELQGTFTLFAWPVRSITLLDMPEAGDLYGSVLCTSDVGSVGLISLKGMDQMFLIPASRSPLRRILIGGKDMLLAYANGKSRVWNVETLEFRRSTGIDAADDMLRSDEWAEVHLVDVPVSAPISSAASHQARDSDLGRLVALDIRAFSSWLKTTGATSTSSPLAAMRSLLSLCLPFGLNEAVDELCTEGLGISRPKLATHMGSKSGAALEVDYSNVSGVWRVTDETTGLRQLAIIALLRPFLDSPDHERAAADVIAFYSASLPPDAFEPDIDFFANYYLDPAPDVQQAARMLFSARLGKMSDEEVEALTEAHQAELPSAQSIQEDRVSARAVRALTMIGGMAISKYQSINPSALKAVSESLVMYLNDPACPELPLAIDLVSKGFTVWQAYVDPMDLLRRLSHFATHKEPSATGSTSIAAQARLAVLHVATSNPALFMSTLSMDILDAKSAAGRNSIMKLCVFLARKQPALLENGLPRIAEAVVKSLDPNVGKMRDDVWQAATVILNELVLAFSTIDFHAATQRLIVGTHEGAVITYDLKTASRLYVLEPHKAPVSALAFSPDGRRVVTVSLDQGDVTVWKVGSSLSGFFNVGGPPRQGHEKGQPFKRIIFTRADDGPVGASTSALSDVQIAWPGERQARVTIGETALTFET